MSNHKDRIMWLEYQIQCNLNYRDLNSVYRYKPDRDNRVRIR